MKKLAIKLVGILSILLAAVFYLQSGETNAASGKASVKVTATTSKTGTTLTFATIPGDGLKINADGPWKLEIKSAIGLKPSSTEFKRDAWKEDISGFEVPVVIEGTSKKADLTFKLTSFVCTKDKTLCYREVVEDKAHVNL